MAKNLLAQTVTTGQGWGDVLRLKIRKRVFFLYRYINNECSEKLGQVAQRRRWMPHLWKHWKPGRMGHWATWSSWRCHCLLQGHWTIWPLKAPSNSNPNYYMIFLANENAYTHTQRHGYRTCLRQHSYSLGITSELALPLDWHNPLWHRTVCCLKPSGQFCWTLPSEETYLSCWPPLLPYAYTMYYWS